MMGECQNRRGALPILWVVVCADGDRLEEWASGIEGWIARVALHRCVQQAPSCEAPT